MKILPYIGFCFLLLCALCTGVNSYHRTKSIIAQDVNRALEQVLAKMPDNVVTTDTIRCYRNCLTIAELKDTAGIAMRVGMDAWRLSLWLRLTVALPLHSCCPTRRLQVLFSWLECFGYWAVCGTSGGIGQR